MIEEAASALSGLKHGKMSQTSHKERRECSEVNQLGVKGV